MTRLNQHRLEEEVVFHAPARLPKEASFGGMCVATLVSWLFWLRPIHILLPIGASLYFQQSSIPAVILASMSFLSLCLPSTAASILRPVLRKWLLDAYYYDYQEIIENHPVSLQESIHNGKLYILACQPYDLVPMANVLHTLQNPTKAAPTAVPSLVLWTPFLKQLWGLLGCMTTPQMKQNFQQKQVQHPMVHLFVGSLTDVFYTTPSVDVLQLSKRKEFIKVALQMPGVDVVPVYLFGHTALFSRLRGTLFIRLSKWMQFPMTYAWGKYGMFVPRREKVSWELTLFVFCSFTET